MTYIKNDIKKAAKLIAEGKTVAFPTETVYGLGANALNPKAVIKIFELKQRPSFDPLIVHIADIEDIKMLTKKYDKRVIELAKNFWPGPLTIILPKSEIVPDIVTSGLKTVGIRMPNNEIALELITRAKTPIAAPSANRFGKVSPTMAEHVKKQLPDVDFILDGGKTNVGIESTIISLNERGFEILRNGIITKEEIEKIIPFSESNKQANKIMASGMMKSHYSPDKPLFFLDEIADFQRNKAGLLSFSGENNGGFGKVIQVTRNRNLREYAVNLFAAIHQMEEDNNVEFIVVEKVPPEGIGLAIMDRLNKATYQYQKK